MRGRPLPFIVLISCLGGCVTGPDPPSQGLAPSRRRGEPVALKHASDGVVEKLATLNSHLPPSAEPPLPKPPRKLGHVQDDFLSAQDVEDSLVLPASASFFETESPTNEYESADNVATRGGGDIIALDLANALGIVGGQSPRIAFARARHREAYARLMAARSLWLPTIRAGVSYHHHDGNLQASAGDIVDVDRSSLQTGLGVQAVGAGTTPVPGVMTRVHGADVVFQPQINAYATSVRHADIRSVSNDTLLETALAYLELLRATQELSIATTTRDQSADLAELTARFASSGQGPQADADRTQTDLYQRQNEVARADEAVQVASARLSELLQADTSLQIVPTEPALTSIELVPPGIPRDVLVATGLSNRPELRAAQHLVCEAVYRYRREKYAPFIPSLLLGVSQSEFGGGLGSTVDDFRGRFDLDASAFWEIRQFGVGEKTRRRETRAQYDQARLQRIMVMDRVAREVAEASAQVQSRRTQVDVAQRGIESATNSFQRDLRRIREGQGLPIEVLQSLRALDEMQREYLRSVAGYNEAQFRLLRALGWPVELSARFRAT